MHIKVHTSPVIGSLGGQDTSEGIERPETPSSQNIAGTVSFASDTHTPSSSASNNRQRLMERADYRETNLASNKISSVSIQAGRVDGTVHNAERRDR